MSKFLGFVAIMARRRTHGSIETPFKAVAVNPEDQQAVLAMHRVLLQLVKIRTMQINVLRGLLTEYGEVMGTSRAAWDKGMPGALEKLADRLPAMLIETLRERYSDLTKLDQQIDKIKQRLKVWTRRDKACRPLRKYRALGY
jgi:transposase